MFSKIAQCSLIQCLERRRNEKYILTYAHTEHIAILFANLQEIQMYIFAQQIQISNQREWERSFWIFPQTD